MKRAVLAGCIAAAAGVAAMAFSTATAAEKKAPKHEVKEIMEKGHKGDMALVQKVLKGSASDADKKLLLEYYQSLAEFTPKKGSAESWKTKTAALIAAAEGIVAGNAPAIAALKDASNCRACHSVHRGQ